MKHYFRVVPAPQKRQGFISSWFSGLSITSWLIFINILIFFILQIIVAVDENLINVLAISGNNLFLNGYFWTLLTSMFMHLSFFHLFVNMLSLFFIGRFLEMLVGRKRYFWLYVLAGIFAGLFFATLSWFFGTSIVGRAIFTDPHTLAVGASGAIFAIAGVLALLTPRNRVYLIAGPLIALIIQAVISIFISSEAVLNVLDLIITIYIFISIFSMISFNPRTSRIAIPIEMPFWLLPIVAIIPLVIIGLFVELPIGNMAHLGGFIAGAFYGIYLRLKYKRKTQAISEYFSK